MKKFTKFLLILILILGVAYLILLNYTKEQKDIQNKIGAKIGASELSMRDYYTLVQCFEAYQGYIAKEDYETAYNMLGYQYKQYVPYEQYLEKIQDKKIDEMRVKDINIITQSTYDILAGTSGDEEHYSIIINSNTNRFALYPESFLDYNVNEYSATRKMLECTLKEYVVNTDKCILKFELTNKNKKDSVTISKATLKTNLNSNIVNDEDIVIAPGETKNISIEFKTDYEFPSAVILERKIEGKDSTIKYDINID